MTLVPRWILVLLSATLVSVLAACGGGSSDVQNPPPPPPSKLAVAFDPPPVNSLVITSTTGITAVVTDDPENAGVDWSVTCSTQGNCGSLSTLHSDSGQEVTYTPPQGLSGNSQSVNIVAFATTDHAKNVAASITITAFGNNLNGAYVFQAKGIDPNLQSYQVAGVVVLDGNGAITSGQQTRNEVAGTLTTSIAQGSSYFVGGDGRGTITINTTDLNGEPITEKFSIVILSPSQALLAELDAPQSSVGTLDLQTSTAAPTAGYAFVVSGMDPFGTPTAFGGVLNIDSPGSISGAGSLADQDYNGSLLTCPAPHGRTGTVSQPASNPFGTVVFDLTGTNCFGSIQLTGYIVDSTHIRLIETDDNGSSGFATSGTAIAQGAATGTFDAASFSDTYVFGLLGTDMNSGIPSSLTSVGVVTADGAGSVTTGFMDTFLVLNSLGEPSQISAQFDSTYSVNSQGIGRVRFVPGHFVPPPHPGFRPVFIFYLTGKGGPALMLDAGGEDINNPSLGAGIAYPRGGTLTLNGKYGVSFTQQNGSENDGTGRMTADSSANPSLSGLVDDTNSGVGNAFALSDNFGSPDSFGRIPGTFLGGAVEYYPIDSTRGFFVQTDLIDPISPSGQVALGYYATRTSVCDGCP